MFNLQRSLQTSDKAKIKPEFSDKVTLCEENTGFSSSYLGFSGLGKHTGKHWGLFSSVWHTGLLPEVMP